MLAAVLFRESDQLLLEAFDGQDTLVNGWIPARSIVVAVYPPICKNQDIEVFE
jgi:hypothetical protein